ncbi:hypothetical protein FQA39_LY15581 [Lamprigera yunnana]|nr:hypothetical protein FQA39_LY15581 [Lamprigera yunnana]
MFEDDETNVVTQNEDFDESDESDSEDHVETRSVDSEIVHEISDDEDTEEPEQEDHIFSGTGVSENESGPPKHPVHKLLFLYDK